MRVKGIRLNNFTIHDDLEKQVPERGLVLVTGVNGQGKSSMVEAVAYALWGETLRGTPPWRPATDGSVEVELYSGLTASRVHKAEKTRLRWQAADAEPVQYENTTKAQEALELRIGSFDIWRRSSVFSSADAAHFTTAGDAVRKRLLEQILSLDRFEPALEACRRDLRLAERESSAATLAAASAEQALGATQSRLEDGERTLSMLQASAAPADIAEKAAKLAELLSSTGKDLGHLRLELREAEAKGLHNEHAAREINRRLNTLRHQNCVVCEQPIPQALLNKLKAEYDDNAEKAQQAHAAAARHAKDTAAEMAELEEVFAALQKRAAGYAATQKQQATLQAQQADQTKLLDRLRKQAVQQELEQGKTAARYLKAAKEQAELEEVDRILGMRGVRAQVLGQALSGIETVANSWLQRIAGPMKLRLRSYTEKKTGGVTDSISLDIEGAGGGFGYRASSGGERRRIDIALLFALAAVTQAAHNIEPGTMVFDEVFDGMDEPGKDAVIEALHDLAKDRAILVISHSQYLVERLKTVDHWHFERKAT